MFPESAEMPVIDQVHGHRLTDPYRWLEEGHSPQTQDWVARQSQYTRDVIASYGMKPAIAARLAQLKDRPDLGLPSGRAGTLIYQRRESGQNHSVLFAQRDGNAIVVADPNQSDEPSHIDWADVSQDGRYIIFGQSQHGNEWAVLHLYDLQTGALLPDRIERARYASVAWPRGADGFYYTRYPHPGEVATVDDSFYHVAVYYHRLGEPAQQDVLVFKPADDKRASPRLALSESGQHLAISVHYGWTRSVLYLMDPNHREVPARRLVDPGDKLIEPLWCGDRLLALTNLSHETGALVEVGLADGSLATLAQSEPGEPWVDAAAFSDSVAIATIRDGESRVLVLDNQSGVERHSLTLPDFAGLVGLSTSDDQLFYQFSGFGRPSAIHVLTCSGGHFVDRVFAEAGAADPTVKVERVWVTSTDGTRFPMLLTWRGDTAPNGPTPTVLAGYGGFNVPYLPSYSPSVHDWIMRGGLYAIAMLRGGGEFGEAWHRAGMRANKQAVFDDFYSATRYLVTQGYTDPTHLGVSGRSNGGLLTGAFVTQHPDAASAAIIGVPLLDMVRFHKFLIADLWTAEYGSPDVAEELEWLLAYSPYHHVRENTAYPAILLFTSEDDSRVDPMHARKMTARLQKATTSARPILFRQAAKTGHGVGKSATEWVDEEADIWTFLSYHLGLSVR